MSIYADTSINFADRSLLEIIFWIFIVPLQSWLLNWMVHSIMRRQGKTMMNPGQHI